MNTNKTTRNRDKDNKSIFISRLRKRRKKMWKWKNGYWQVLLNFREFGVNFVYWILLLKEVIQGWRQAYLLDSHVKIPSIFYVIHGFSLSRRTRECVNAIDEQTNTNQFISSERFSFNANFSFISFSTTVDYISIRMNIKWNTENSFSRSRKSTYRSSQLDSIPWWKKAKFFFFFDFTSRILFDH